MNARVGTPNLHDLLGRAAWAQRLARQLVRDDSEADDLLQEAWLVAANAPPGEAPSRGWLAGVLRVLGMRQARAAARRRQRERESASDRATAGPAEASRPDELLDQVDTQRRLSEALLALAEPYRTAVLLRYYEELSAAEIARRTDVPAGTVRWRIKEGLDRLRRQLDEQAGGRRASVLALVKFATPRRISRVGRLTIGAGLAAGLMLAGVVTLSARPPGPARVSLRRSEDNGARDAPGKASEMKKRIGALAVVATLAAHPDAGLAAAQHVPPSKVPRFWVPLGVGPVKGPATAKVTIIAFLDYQSAFCLRASEALEPVLAAHAGEVRYQVIQRPLPFHRRAPFASRAAFAAGQQGKFWEMHQVLLANPGALEDRDLESYAKKLGLDVARFQADLVSPTVTNQVDLEEANAQSLKVAAIPTFFFNGRTVGGAQPRARFEQALAEELTYADAVLKAGVRPADLYTTITRQGATELAGGPLPDGEPGAEGPAGPEFQAARKILADNAATARGCYQEGLAHRPGLAGTVVVELRLAAAREPTVLLRDSTLNFAKVDNCIVQALKRLSYPKLSGNNRLLVRYPFTFPGEVGPH